MTEEEKVRVLALELTHMQKAHGDIQLRVGFVDAYGLVACLQLAWRYPGLSSAQRRMIEEFVGQIAAVFEAYPVANSTIKDGWDTRQDVRF